jgi:hypothetical protein
MTDLIQIVAIAVSLVLLTVVLELVRRRRLSEEYSLIWIVCAVALLGLSVARRRLDRIALSLDIYYPPALLILVLFFFVFVASLYFSVVISRQREQIERLIEEVAVLSALVGENTARLHSLAATRGFAESVSADTASKPDVAPDAT